jgi:CheY-like chemotaxis protein
LPPRDSPSRPSRPFGLPRVLVVDDDHATRVLCATVLQREGYEVLEATNGQEGLELALDQAPDVVLLDISMPVLDGFGLAAALRADERTRDLPLIFVTAESDPVIKAKAFETGAHGFITKPFDPRVVSSFIHRLLAQAVPKRTLRVVDGFEGPASQ